MQLQIVKTIGSFVRNVNKTYLLSLSVHVFWSIFNRKLTVEFVLIVVHNRYHHRWSYMLSMVDRCFFCFLYLDSIYFCKILRMHRFTTLVVLRWHCLDGAKEIIMKNITEIETKTTKWNPNLAIQISINLLFISY